MDRALLFGLALLCCVVDERVSRYMFAAFFSTSTKEENPPNDDIDLLSHRHYYGFRIGYCIWDKK